MNKKRKRNLSTSLTDTEQKLIIRLVNDFLSTYNTTAKIIRKLNLSCEKSTVYKFLHKNKIHHNVAEKVPYLGNK